MNVIRFGDEDREQWLAARRGKITGSKIKDIFTASGVTKDAIAEVLTDRGVVFKKTAKKEELEALLSSEDLAGLRSRAPKKKGFYVLIAEKLGLPAEEGETEMERGTRLEKDAIARFIEENPGVEVDTSMLIWTRDDDEEIAISPDGVIGTTEAIEAKCLSSANHIKAFIERRIPEDYLLQALQYFVVNDDLKILHFIFFDPRFLDIQGAEKKKIDYFELTLTRDQAEHEIQKIDEMLAYERDVIEQVNFWVNKITL